MIKELLKIRLKQFVRILKEIGVIRTIILVALFIFVLGVINEYSQKDSSIIYVLLIYSFFIFYVNLKREDVKFIKLYFPKYYFVFLFENILISIPLIIILLINQLWIWVLFFVVFVFLVSFFHFTKNQKTINSFFQRIIPDENFEWKSGFRKNLYLIVFLWIIGLSASFFIGTIPVVIFVLGIIILNFYEQVESIQILIADGYGTKKFIFKKVTNHLRDYFVLVFPLVIIFMIFHIEYYYISLIIFFVFAFLIFYSILLKYTFYRPNEKSGAMQTFTVFGILSIFVPFLLPVTFMLTIVFAFKAINNLNFYLDDFNQKS